MILFSYQLIPNNPLNFSGRVSFDKEIEIFCISTKTVSEKN